MKQIVLWHDSQAQGALPSEDLGQLGAHPMRQTPAGLLWTLPREALIPLLERCLQALESQRRTAEKNRPGVITLVAVTGPPDQGRSRDLLGEDALAALEQAAVRAVSFGTLAEPGELLVERKLQSSLAGAYLFARQITGRRGMRADSVDARWPRRSDAARAISELAPPTLPGGSRQAFQNLARLAGGPGRHRILLVGKDGTGSSDWLRRLADRLAPPIWLEVTSFSGALPPLGSLGHALRRLEASRTPLTHWLDVEDERQRRCLEALRRIGRGEFVQRGEAVAALRALLRWASQEGSPRPWVSIRPVGKVDPASLSVVAAATGDGAPDNLVFLHMRQRGKPPAAFVHGGQLAELRLPELSPEDALAMSRALLGQQTEASAWEAAARLGGSSAAGVVEAVRLLVGNGDLVLEEGRFRWRTQPRQIEDSLPVARLVEERIRQLTPSEKQLLEVLCCVADPTQRRVVEQVAESDGMSAEEHREAFRGLEHARLLPESSRAQASTELVSRVVRLGMTPARSAHLHAQIGQVLENGTPSGTEGFERATLGYHLAEAGKTEKAVTLLLKTAVAAGKLGYTRAAVRLAAVAVERDPSPETQRTAARIARGVSAPPPEVEPLARRGPEGRSTEGSTATRADAPVAVGPCPNGHAQGAPAPAPATANGEARTRTEPHASDRTSAPTREAKDVASELDGESVEHAADSEPAPGATSDVVGFAIEAIINRDFDGADRSIELAIARGDEGAGVARLQAMSLLSRGDTASASLVLQRTRHRSAAGREEGAREALAQALVMLASGDTSGAVRASLRALARSREGADVHGQRASLRTLARCYRTLGRDGDAESLEASF